MYSNYVFYYVFCAGWQWSALSEWHARLSPHGAWPAVISLQINPTDNVQHQWCWSNIWWHLSNHVNTVNCPPILTSKDVHSILFKHALFKHVQMHPHLVQRFIVVLSKKQGGVACSENTAPSYTILHKSATLCPVSSLATKSWVLMYYNYL